MTKDEIKRALKMCAGTCFRICCPYGAALGDCCGKLKRDALNLIAEQEQEIEQLKENLKNLKDDFESLQKDYEFVRDCDAEHCLEIEETVKQAKIDVLNELKKYLHTEDFDTPDERWKPESEFCAIIDELIKEIWAQ